MEKQEELIQEAALPRRRGPVVPNTGKITGVGFLEEMEDFAAGFTSLEKPETSLHILRIVATPGLGKVDTFMSKF